MFETSVGIRYADSGITGTGDGPGIVLANLELAFERPLARTGPVAVGVEVADLGESSIPFGYEIRDGGDLVATAETTVVVVDRETGRSQPIPAGWRDRITAFEG